MNSYNKKTIEDIDVAGKRVLVRCDFNVPLKDGVFNQTSVAWSLAWGLVLLRINDSKRLPHWLKAVMVFAVCAITFPSDWSCVAAVAILFMGNARGNFKQQMIWMMIWSATYAAVYFIFLDKIYGVIQLFTCLTIPLLRLYNGERGKWKGMGKLFYVYYPAHLFVIGILRVLLWG